MSEAQNPVLVLDASVAISIVRREPTRPQLAAQIRTLAAAKCRFIVPDVFWVELANVLVRRHAATPEDVVEALREIDEQGLESIRADRPMLLATVDLQHRHRLSAYDATYLALAEAEDAQLLTLDRRLAAAAGRRAVALDGVGSTHLSEAPETYERDPIDWARFGPYLARLRADAREAATRH